MGGASGHERKDGSTDLREALESARAERDAIAAKAFRQRERLQSLWQQARTSKLASDDKLRRTRADLEAARRSLGYRLEAAIRRRIRAVTSRGGSGGPRPSAPPRAAVVPPELELDARRFRTGLLERVAAGSVAAGGASAAGPLRLAVVAGPTGAVAQAAVARNLSGLDGIAASTEDLAALATGGGRPFDAVLLLDPVEFEGLPDHPIRIAWLGDVPEPWLDRAGFDDLDLVLVASAGSRAIVEARSAKVATVVASPDTTDGAAALRNSLLRWIELRHVALHIGPVTREAAAGWGDLPFGRAVQRAFERRGLSASVHVHAERDSVRAVRADHAIHIFGVRAPAVRRGQPTLLWIISHPDHVTRELVTAYDAVGVASTSFLEELRRWLGPDAPPTFPLHQATDPEWFFPEAGGPSHELLFVGSSRKVRRPILDDLADTSHDLAVYGGGWTPDLIDPRHLRGEWVPNAQLRRFYAGAAIVLSDAYADMRDEGFIANRVYDALASGAFVISEPVAGLDEEFDGAVVAYRDRAELHDRVDHYLAHPAERRALAEVGRRAVLARHTFAHRVAAIIDAFDTVEPRSADPRG